VKVIYVEMEVRQINRGYRVNSKHFRLASSSGVVSTAPRTYGKAPFGSSDGVIEAESMEKGGTGDFNLYFQVPRNFRVDGLRLVWNPAG
jgi:hypothetical protein